MEDEPPPPITPNGSSLPIEAPGGGIVGGTAGADDPPNAPKSSLPPIPGGMVGAAEELVVVGPKPKPSAPGGFLGDVRGDTFLAGAAASAKPISSRAFSAEPTFVDAVGAGADSSPSCSSEGGRPSASRRPSSRGDEANAHASRVVGRTDIASSRKEGFARSSLRVAATTGGVIVPDAFPLSSFGSGIERRRKAAASVRNVAAPDSNADEGRSEASLLT